MLKQGLTVWLSLSIGIAFGVLGFSQLAAEPVLVLPRDITDCPDDMVRVGSVCIDKYEASVWDTADGMGTQYGASSDDYPCSDNGNNCSNIFAISKTGVPPSANITWFQAGQACANVGKRLPTNAEWQLAAAGTFDIGLPYPFCNSFSDTISLTGSFVHCVSRWGAHDMVGNVWEWTADWIQDNSDFDGGATSTTTYGSDAVFGIDEAQLLPTRFPSGLHRGGSAYNGTDAGVFAVRAGHAPSRPLNDLGFRCAR